MGIEKVDHPSFPVSKGGEQIDAEHTELTRVPRGLVFCMPKFGEKCKLVDFDTIKWALNSMPNHIIIRLEQQIAS